MQSFAPDSLITILAAAAPLVLLAAGLVPSKVANRHCAWFAAAVAWAACIAFACAVALAIMLGISNLPAARFVNLGVFALDLYIDALTGLMLLLVSFLCAVVTRYSIRYMAGDPRQGRFSKWLAVTSGCVLLLVVSGNLLLFTLAWIATSLSLHQLLVFYGERPGAAFSARKKFIVSRIGDACLLASLALTWHCFGTWQFSALFSTARELAPGSENAACLQAISCLLVLGALLKSAQFPFHSWLPDTMETPTPVSALMHAGIINAGGFLIVRLSPIVSMTPAALNGLAIAGAVTALFASVVMLTQTSVKRSLAYSTIAQMGFMMLQCGLGAFALAVVHIVAHSLYKAFAFLSSGGIVQLARASWVPREPPAAHPFILAASLATAALACAMIGGLFGVNADSNAETLLLGSVFTMAVAFLLWNLWGSTLTLPAVAGGCLMTAGASVAYFALHKGANWLLAPALPVYAPVRTFWEYGVMAVLAGLFLTLLVFQSQLPVWSKTSLGRAFYVHVSNGLYVGTIAHRLLVIFAPKADAKPS